MSKQNAQQAEATESEERLVPAPDEKVEEAGIFFAYHERQLECFRQSLEAEGEGAYDRWGLAMFHSLPDEDIEAQRVALKWGNRDALDHFNAGCLSASREEYGKAATAFAKAVELDPALSDAAYNHALALEKAGRADPARRAWQAYVEKYPESGEVGEVNQHLTEPAEA